MSTGCKGFVYRGRIVRYAWDARKGCRCYEVSDPTRPQGAKVTFITPREAMRFVDRQEGKR
jgi:hypothetical protein